MAFAEDIVTHLNLLNVDSTSSERQVKLIEHFYEIIDSCADARKLGPIKEFLFLCQSRKDHNLALYFNVSA